MRALLLEHGPALEHWFGIHPWDYSKLSPAELRVRIEALDDIHRERR